MKPQLLNDEAKQSEIFLDNEVLTLTDKRLIYYNSQSSNSVFVGINELRGANVSTVNVTYATMQVSDTKLLYMRIGLGLMVAFGCYMAYATHETGGAFFISMTFGMLLFSPVAAIVTAIIIQLLSFYIKATAKTVQRSQISITKTDDTYFINSDYDLSMLSKLQAFEAEMNNLIYK